MQFTAHFRLLNYDFSPEFAEAHHNGEPSENNRFYDWEDELVLKTPVKKIEVLRNNSYVLRGTLGKDQSFEESVPDMLVFEIHGQNGDVTIMACSEKLVNGYVLSEEANRFILEVDLEAKEPCSNPVPGIYIAAVDFPKSLIIPD
ncbi:MAG: hypothetical protein JJT77_08665 [Crocinitomicaceae bacterium]|jgi:hypothetical protein|nr:hypothetical protein [Crocinitomicaceae bacterium]